MHPVAVGGAKVRAVWRLVHPSSDGRNRRREAPGQAANTAAVQSETATVGRMVEQSQIQNMMLNGRNPVWLALLKAGVRSGNSLATFNYEVKSYMRMTKGDRQTLAREAEAITALATERHAISACRACGTQITDESHFCRRCGAPLVLDVPELEILRLTSGARSSYHNIAVGSFALLLASVVVAILFMFTGVRITPIFWVGFCIAIYGLVTFFQGAWQLHFALNPKKTTKNALPSALPAFKSSVTTALPPAPARTSVTEGTTELLTRDRREKEPVLRKDHDTAEIDTDRLM